MAHRFLDHLRWADRHFQLRVEALALDSERGSGGCGVCILPVPGNEREDAGVGAILVHEEGRRSNACP